MALVAGRTMADVRGSNHLLRSGFNLAWIVRVRRLHRRSSCEMAIHSSTCAVSRLISVGSRPTATGLEPVSGRISRSKALGIGDWARSSRSVLGYGLFSRLSAWERVVAAWDQRRLTTDGYGVGTLRFRSRRSLGGANSTGLVPVSGRIGGGRPLGLTIRERFSRSVLGCGSFSRLAARERVVAS